MQINVSNASSSHVLPVSNAEACPALSKPQIPWNEIFDNPKGNMYSYSRLQPDSIRLLGLMPHEDENAPIQGQLFDYPLHKLDKRTHLYEALS
jgi:hypothetical protein